MVEDGGDGEGIFTHRMLMQRVNWMNEVIWWYWFPCRNLPMPNCLAAAPSVSSLIPLPPKLWRFLAPADALCWPNWFELNFSQILDSGNCVWCGLPGILTNTSRPWFKNDRESAKSVSFKSANDSERPILINDSIDASKRIIYSRIVINKNQINQSFSKVLSTTFNSRSAAKQSNWIQIMENWKIKTQKVVKRCVQNN